MSPRRRYHVSAAGTLYVFVTVLVALGAFNSQNNLLFWFFGLALALLVVSGLVSGAMLMGTEIRREPGAEAAAGEPLFVRYTVRNTNRLVPLFGLAIRERLPARFPGAARSVRRATIGPSFAFISHVAPGSSVTATGTASALSRGLVAFDEIVATTTFPFGIVRKSLIYSQPQVGTVVPRAALQRGRVAVASVRATIEREHASTARTGDSDEYFGLRPYQPGDSPRLVAWKASARMDDLLVRQTASSTPRRLWIVLRVPPGARDEEAVESAIELAAGILQEALPAGVAVGLAIPGADVVLGPEHGRGHARQVLTALAAFDPADPGFDAGASFPRPAADRRARCLVIHAGPVDRTYGPAWCAHTDAAGVHAAEGGSAVA